VVVVALSLLLKMPPANIVQLVAAGKRQAGAQVVASQQSSLAEKTPANPAKITPIYKTLPFWLFFIWVTVIIASGITLIGDVKPGALALQIDDGLATLLVGTVSIANGLSRIAVGFIFDKAGLKAAMLSGGVAALVAAVALAASFASAQPAAYVAGALVMGFAYGAGPVLGSAFVRTQYGQEGFAKNLSQLNLCVAVGAFLSIAIVAIGRSLGGDFGIYAIIAVLAAIDLALVFALAKAQAKTN
jgi:OFA family oxalate/formate antiporter-like MFS transporter